MTDAEHRLWQHLRGHRFAGLKFRRQHPIGDYIVDFCCSEKHLIIELDGGQHATQSEQDEARTAYLQHLGWQVLRFWNTDMLSNTEGVLQHILVYATHPNTPN